MVVHLFLLRAGSDVTLTMLVMGSGLSGLWIKFTKRTPKEERRRRGREGAQKHWRLHHGDNFFLYFLCA